jgi:hypothetical protein
MLDPTGITLLKSALDIVPWPPEPPMPCVRIMPKPITTIAKDSIPNKVKNRNIHFFINPPLRFKKLALISLFLVGAYQAMTS